MTSSVMAENLIPSGRRSWLQYMNDYLVAAWDGEQWCLDSIPKLEKAAENIARYHRENPGKAYDYPTWWAKGLTGWPSPEQRGNQNPFSLHWVYSGPNNVDWWNLRVVLRQKYGLDFDLRSDRDRQHALGPAENRVLSANEAKNSWGRLQRRAGKRVDLIPPGAQNPQIGKP